MVEWITVWVVGWITMVGWVDECVGGGWMIMWVDGRRAGLGGDHMMVGGELYA